jgi:glucan phosphoethanolaminetransferase (alkaline phosphatase superfamily)
MKDKTLLTIIGISLAIAVVVIFSLGITWLLTYGLILVINGIFEVNYFPKFWYIFCGLYIIQYLFRLNTKSS